MKQRQKKILISGIAVAAAGVLGAEALLQTQISVQASAAMMPGIEEILDEKAGDKPFRILEIVDDTSEAEIGYYVSGQEPYILLYEYTDKNNNKIRFSTLEEGLSRISDKKQRKEFAENVKLDESGNVTDESTGIRQISDVLWKEGNSSANTPENYPLSFTEYQEKYFLDTGDDENEWKRIDFLDDTGKSRTDTVKIPGYYQENQDLKGDYTKEDVTYSPIREDVTEDQAIDPSRKYRENIQSFLFSEGMPMEAPYFLEFDPVSNSVINESLGLTDSGSENQIQSEYDISKNRYGYFENVYTSLSKEIVTNIEKGEYLFPGENPKKPEGSTSLPLFKNETTYAVDAFDSMSTEQKIQQAEQQQAQQQNPVEEAPGQGTSTDGTAPVENGPVSDGGFSSGEVVPVIQEPVFAQEDAFVSEMQEVQQPVPQDLTGDISADVPGETIPQDPTGDISADVPGETIPQDPTGDVPADVQQDISQDIPDDTLQTNPQLQAQADGQDGNELEMSLEETPAIGEGYSKDETSGTSANPYIYVSETISVYPNFKYQKVGDLEYVKNKAEACANADKEATEQGKPVSRKEGDITIEDDQYWYWKPSSAEPAIMERTPLNIVTGRQAVAQDMVRKLPEDLGYSYYYRVSAAYFCCKKNETEDADAEPWKFYGWYYPEYVANEDTYLPVKDDETATYYISEDVYNLTPDSGDYDFIPDETREECSVQVNHMFYKGGYTNNDWLKRYVFNLDPTDPETKEQFENFRIQVDTLLTAEAEAKYGTKGRSAGAASYSVEEQTGFSDSGEEQAGFSDSSGEADISAEQTADAGETVADTQEDVFSDADTSEVSVPVSYAQEILGLETAQEVVLTEETEDTQETAEFTSGEETALFTSARAAADTTEDLELEDYDLIYVNGRISEATAKAIVDNRIPVIINQRILGLQGAGSVAAAFVDYLKNENADADSHYVSQFVYVFCLKANAGENAVENSLLNLSFHEDFSGNTDTVAGFEEITQYINEENEYRQLGVIDTTTETASLLTAGETEENAFTDTDTTTSAFSDSSSKAALLTTEISQARAIEYIINYKYKRVVLQKDEINVLEIHPANKTNLSASTVANWVYDAPKFTDAEASSWDNTRPALQAIDGNKSGIDNFWDAAWSGNTSECTFASGVKKEDNQWIKLTISGDPTLIKGIRYYPRMKDTNTVLDIKFIPEYTIEILDGNNKVLISQNGTTDNSKIVQDIIFDSKMPANAKYIKLTAKTNSQNGSNFYRVSIAELEIIPATNINITAMSSAEYVGHIDDINAKYDMIYIGSQIENVSGTKQNVYLGRDSENQSTNQRLYSHTGGLVKGDSIVEKKRRELLGLMNREWANFPATTNKQLKLNGAEFRGSGNDITEQQYQELMDFVVSGYPVVISDGLMKNSVIDTAKVDNSSYIYKFMSEALAYSNVMTETEANGGNGISFYANLGKPEIVFAENTGRPAEAVRANADSSSSLGSDYIDENGNIVGTYGNVSGELRYQFEINNTSEISPANIRYDCRLYLDLNFDGNFSNAEEQTKYIEIRDKDNRVESKIPTDDPNVTTYQLRSGVKYTLIRKLPSDYFKVIPWKLEIAVASNTSIRTSVTGYAKQKKPGDNPVVVNVLQIAPSAGKALNSSSKHGTWDLQEEWTKGNSVLRDNMEKITDFDLNIETKTVEQFDTEIEEYEKYKENPETYMKTHTQSPTSPTAGQHMLIIGFDDCYENMSEASANAILKFIEDGRSVIFAHDTTSTYNYTYESLCKTDKDKYDKWLRGQADTNSIDTTNWGVSLNSILRNIVGMDRYGITSEKSFAGETVETLLKKGQPLKNGEKDVDFSELLKNVSDIAYAYGEKGEESTWQVQGYTNSQLQEGGDFAGQANKVNDGVITQYPYALKDIIDISNTHGQYYQLAMEQDRDINGKSDGKNDIVVWYCLPGRNDNKLYSVKNDVRNNYYFYSKGNVIYTGAGHSTVDKEDEVRLFINAMIAAANVTAVKPEVTFVESLNPAAKEERVRYYATDQSVWNEKEGNLLEKDMPFYINVKDYNMVGASLENDQENTDIMTAEFYIAEDSVKPLPEDEASLQKLLEEDKLINLGKQNGTGKQGIVEIQAYGSNAPISANNEGQFVLNGNNAYGFNLREVEQYLKDKDTAGGYKTDFKVYVRITSTVTLYGENTTNYSWDSIDLKQRQLFDLD